jgi:hypothetical protein
MAPWPRETGPQPSRYQQVHHSVILELNIASYRLEAAKQAKPPEVPVMAAAGD